MAYTMTPARRAALKKAQQASARKRRGKNKKLKRNIKRAVIAAGAITAAGVTTHVAYRHRGTIKKHISSTKKKAKAKAENNPTVRTAVTKHLMDERRSRPKRNGLKLASKYRMGRPEVRRKRKAARNG